jgi:isopentenyl diphosphate isomerase/L-lactate dehydrogenase-like FMN-dependent dehydrogenase
LRTEPHELLTLRDYERAAEAVLPPEKWAYLASGAGDEQTLDDNVTAFRRWRLRPRMLVDVQDVAMASTILGTSIAMPVLVAPTAQQRLFHVDGERATARAAAAAGTIMCAAAAGSCTMRSVYEAAPDGARWFQMHWYRDQALNEALLAQAAELGFEALVLTVDSPVLGTRDRAVRGGHVTAEMTLLRDVLGERADDVPPGAFVDIDRSLVWDDFESIVSTSPLPILVNGLLTAADAVLAADHGASGIIVSNHGGRQLDGVQATLDALPAVVNAVGDRVEILLDGGVRRGGDVVKAIALGARAVLIGRPVVHGLAVAGEDGVRAVLDILAAELVNALILMGCPSPACLTREYLTR